MIRKLLLLALTSGLAKKAYHLYRENNRRTAAAPAHGSTVPSPRPEPGVSPSVGPQN